MQQNSSGLPSQSDMAEEMRRSARVIREAGGHDDIADGNDAIAEYIEGLECGLAAERKLSQRRTAERDEARAQLWAVERKLGAAEHQAEEFGRLLVECLPFLPSSAGDGRGYGLLNAVESAIGRGGEHGQK